MNHDTRPIRIFLSGCSGVGKTTLAKALADILKFDYVTSSASEAWPQIGVTSHAETRNLGPANALKYQRLVQDIRVNKLRKEEGHVITDRGSMDMLVYLDDYQMNQDGKREFIGEIMDDLLKDLEDYRCLFIKVVKPFKWVTEDNGKRIPDELYQTYSNMKFVGLDFRSFMPFGKESSLALKRYYNCYDLNTNFMSLKLMGTRGGLCKMPVGMITSEVLQKRILGVIQMLVNLEYIEQDYFDALFKSVSENKYDPKDYQ